MRAIFHNRSSVAPLIVLRYGELTLKSPPVRREFERTLRHNVVEHFAAASLSCRLRNDQGHLYVEVDEATIAQRVLGRVFGITSMSEVVECSSDRAEMTAAALALLDPILAPGATFAVRARRTGQHSFTSQQLAADLGGDILEKFADRKSRWTSNTRPWSSPSRSGTTGRTFPPADNPGREAFLWAWPVEWPPCWTAPAPGWARTC